MCLLKAEGRLLMAFPLLAIAGGQVTILGAVTDNSLHTPRISPAS
jgi:hypothetical protein